MPPIPLTRRTFVGGALATVVLVACGKEPEPGEAATDATTAAGPWEFTDARGETISLEAPPDTIAGYVAALAPLWDWGVRPAAVYGPQRSDGEVEAVVGNIDLDTVESLGQQWGLPNIERLVALDADVLISGRGKDGTLDIDPEVMDEVETATSVIAVQNYGPPLAEIFANYEALAAALGADVGSDEVVEARAAHAASVTAFEEAVAANPDLVAMFTFADTDGLWVAKAPDFPDITEFARLGLSVVEPGGPDLYWELLSWEEADRYPADVIFHDERSFSLQPDQLEDEQPTWSALPAVRAGQITGWNAEAPLSYQGFAASLDRLTEAVAGAEVVR